MKKYILAATVLVSAMTIQSCNTENKKETTTTMEGMDHKDTTKMGNMDHGNMEGMHGGMKDMKMTGDFDYDFANTMIIHHQSAVDMAKDVLAKGNNADVKKMAQNIVTAQEAEIAQFKTILSNYKMPEMKKETGESHNELAEIMEKMESDMKAVTMSGNADKDFLMMMIPHHKSAVIMGEEELSHGKNLELKKIAQKIMEDQNKEIKEFEGVLSKMN